MKDSGGVDTGWIDIPLNTSTVKFGNNGLLKLRKIGSTIYAVGNDIVTKNQVNTGNYVKLGTVSSEYKTLYNAYTIGGYSLGIGLILFQNDGGVFFCPTQRNWTVNDGINFYITYVTG